MISFAHQYPYIVVAPTGERYAARVYGAQMPNDNRWEGWFVFFPLAGGEALPTERETTQPHLADIAYWAGGIEPVYLEGALQRALDRTPGAELLRHRVRPPAFTRAEADAYRETERADYIVP